jgi:ribosomal-protein-alanine N-acetyltransferase
MTESDLERIVEIEQTCFPMPWGLRSFQSEINTSHAFNIIIKKADPLEKKSIWAYSCAHVVGEELTILRMAVVPEKRRLGIGERLLVAILDQAIKRGATMAFLEVRPSNIQAQSLYRKKGFRVIGTRPDYYPETGEDALVMMKSLKEIS